VLVAWVTLLLVVSPVLVAGGAVRRDPVTGKWVEAADGEVASDPRASRDSRASSGEDDGGFFGGFAFVDNRAKPHEQTQNIEAVDSLPSLADMDDRVLSRDLAPRSSKYSHDTPLTQDMLAQMQTNVQTTASAIDPEILVQQSSDGSSIGPTRPSQKIESYIHNVPTDQAAVQLSARALTTKPIGNLCRFQGFAPLTACPKEASSGCVDRIPCSRACQADGFFSYRCKGPQIVSKSYALTAAQETPVPRPPSDDYVKLLTDNLKNAMQSNDYTALARLIVNAQQGRAGAAAAASALAQIAQESNGAPDGNSIPISGMDVEEVADGNNVDVTNDSARLVPINGHRFSRTEFESAIEGANNMDTVASMSVGEAGLGAL